jgi:hypothetical protein
MSRPPEIAEADGRHHPRALQDLKWVSDRGGLTILLPVMSGVEAAPGRMRDIAQKGVLFATGPAACR